MVALHNLRGLEMEPALFYSAKWSEVKWVGFNVPHGKRHIQQTQGRCPSCHPSNGVLTSTSTHSVFTTHWVTSGHHRLFEFNVPFQHKYGYVRWTDTITACPQLLLLPHLCVIILRLSWGFTSHSTQNRSFRRRSSQPVSWLTRFFLVNLMAYKTRSRSSDVECCKEEHAD